MRPTSMRTMQQPGHWPMKPGYLTTPVARTWLSFASGLMPSFVVLSFSFSGRYDKHHGRSCQLLQRVPGRHPE